MARLGRENSVFPSGIFDMLAGLVMPMRCISLSERALLVDLRYGMTLRGGNHGTGIGLV